MTIDQAIDKIRKLLALATSDNPHEAAQAAARAQEILDRYEINRAMLAIDAGDVELDEPIENFATKDAPLDAAKAVATWKGCLSRVLAEVNQCRVYTSRNDNGRTIEIVGRAGNVQKVRYLYAYLVHEIERLCARDGRGCGRTWRNNYRHGVIDTVAKALRAARAHAADELRREVGANARALMRVDQALARIDAHSRALDRWCSSNLNLRAASHSARSNKSAHQRGQEAGHEIKINGARGALEAGRRQIRGS